MRPKFSIEFGLLPMVQSPSTPESIAISFTGMTMGRAGSPSKLMTGVAHSIEGDNVISLTSTTRWPPTYNFILISISVACSKGWQQWVHSYCIETQSDKQWYVTHWSAVLLTFFGTTTCHHETVVMTTSLATDIGEKPVYCLAGQPESAFPYRWTRPNVSICLS